MARRSRRKLQRRAEARRARKEAEDGASSDSEPEMVAKSAKTERRRAQKKSVLKLQCSLCGECYRLTEYIATQRKAEAPVCNLCLCARAEEQAASPGVRRELHQACTLLAAIDRRAIRGRKGMSTLSDGSVDYIPGLMLPLGALPHSKRDVLLRWKSGPSPRAALDAIHRIYRAVESYDDLLFRLERNPRLAVSLYWWSHGATTRVEYLDALQRLAIRKKTWIERCADDAEASIAAAAASLFFSDTCDAVWVVVDIMHHAASDKALNVVAHPAWPSADGITALDLMTLSDSEPMNSLLARTLTGDNRVSLQPIALRLPRSLPLYMVYALLQTRIMPLITGKLVSRTVDWRLASSYPPLAPAFLALSPTAGPTGGHAAALAEALATAEALMSSEREAERAMDGLTDDARAALPVTLESSSNPQVLVWNDTLDTALTLTMFDVKTALGDAGLVSWQSAAETAHRTATVVPRQATQLAHKSSTSSMHPWI
ncbi:uncharacterized protein AMSG_06711 [Thecamonas trahens ATCC 50062]|uniref:Uncharacterized protein n=1 Tax=Thecamonas trahens ATCC 50062 TaxID=461836 RepID=A0A0L0DET9_THETB|nr:hypothetical protein AMSG_06711 [Thecamonas trahens ATCC 50062]KNC50809.1 hypothetical protein AMSG_06711 [Thecamonas trahens ATCC 50062]|eukprot:XP_013756765.1 hypothetical protein AMSG_06711 [Thecamonas trahens ATCC 50062]